MKENIICFILITLFLVGIAYAEQHVDEWGNVIETVTKGGEKGITVQMSSMVVESDSEEWIAEKARRKAVTDERKEEQEVRKMISDKERELATQALIDDDELEYKNGKLKKKK